MGGVMNVLVTGGAGYIGSNLVDLLRQAGHNVRVLDLQPTGSEHLADPGCDCVRGNTTDPNLVTQVVRDIDVVYHLAWTLQPGEERREVQENLSGTLNLLEAALAARVRHFLFASSAVVYGPTGLIQVREKQPCYPEKSTIGGAMYGIAKLACERLCLVYQRRGLPATIFRMHGVFSAGHLGQFEKMIEEALVGEIVKAVRGAGGEYTHLDDVLRAFLLATGTPKAQGEVFNLAGSHTYSDPSLAQFIVEATGSESQVVLVENPAERMISVSVEKLHTFLGYRPRRGEFLTAVIRRALEKA
jgi:UDP-glucose 4-epimerase